MGHPLVIQGGMGIGVSGWRLANAVAARGQLGVVSGTAIAQVIAGRLRAGDRDVADAVAAFPEPAVAERARDLCLRRDASVEGWRPLPMATFDGPPALVELTVVAAFAEVWLAKRGHDGVVGMNLLEKIALPTAPSLYGAMLAGVDYILMGAGIPRAIPGLLDALAEHRPVEVRLPLVDAAAGDEAWAPFAPSALLPGALPPLKRPAFLAIVGSDVLAQSLLRNASGRIDGFIVENQFAGGHNAPPRGALRLSERGEPLYGPRDIADTARLRALGVPFWLAGERATRAGLADALAAGATGVQIGTAFAFCRESGIEEALKRRVLRSVLDGTIDVFTDPRASPTGFPFKIARVPGTIGDDAVYAERNRVCDKGYLRDAYRRADGTIGYRCAGEPEAAYLAKGGELADTVGRKCLCNGLLATIGQAHLRSGGAEPAMVTTGEAVRDLGRFLADGDGYDAAAVLDELLGAASVGAPVEVAP